MGAAQSQRARPEGGVTVGFFHVGRTVADLDRALEFYSGVLGLEVVSRRTIREEYAWWIWGLRADRVRAAFLRIPGSEALVELFEFVGADARPVTGRPCDPGVGHFCVYVDDAEAVLRRAVSMGFGSRSDEVVRIPDGTFAGAKVVYLLDADGHHVEAYECPG